MVKTSTMENDNYDIIKDNIMQLNLNICIIYTTIIKNG